ncbi:MAG: glutathione synthetase [Planctomycetota bacterium]|nr:glutathione synthetase [Planctomycetota bacterium]
MRIGFCVNDVATEEAAFTTTRLAQEAVNQGHESWTFGVGDFAYSPDDKIRASARSVKKKKYKSHELFLKDLQGKDSVRERICVDDLDVLMLRNVPSDDYLKRPWASGAATEFARLAVRRGVIVVNDPSGLAKAASKMYFQLFPEEVRPKTLITRDNADIKAFAHEQGGTIVLKPLQGSGGASVFLVRPDDIPNLNQMIDAVSRDGFVIAQEYLPAAERGDMRLFVMNGRPLRVKGKYCAFRRERTSGDMRSNIHAGGKKAAAIVDDVALHIAEIVRPKLVQDGMFLVGLDIVGDKLMEINVFSPGGLGSAQTFANVRFTHTVIEALDRKVQYMKFYGRNFDNIDMCTL